MKQFSRRDSLPAPGHEGAAFSNLTTALVAVISLLFSTGALVALPGESTELGEYSQIAIGDTIKGVLEPIDGRLSSGQIVDRFTFEATEGQELLISLASYDFDPFLWLLNAKGNVLTIDDDSGDALGAVISDFTVPETGMYTVRVSSYSDSETGEYVFTLSEIPLIDNPFSISIGQGINGELSLNDPQFSSGQLYDVYSFEASPDRPVFISMISDSLDPNLWLFTKEGRVLSANDNIGSIESEGTTQSLITFLPPTEDIFTIIASSRGSTEVGMYTLALDAGPAPIIVRGERLVGTLFQRLESSDFQLDTGQYLDVYAFQGKRNEAVSVTLVSEDFDSYLVILDQTGEILATDDDSGFGSDALVADLLLPADGRYYAWVYSVFAGETGDYLLELSNANENDGELPLKKVVDPEEGMTLMMKRKSRPLVQPRDILGLDFNWETIPDITRKKGDPFTDADRCKGSSAPYEAKVNVCVWTRPGYTGPGTGFPFNVTIYVEGFTDSTEMNEDDGITITPPAFVTKPIPAPGECVTFAKWVIITENASAGAKSIRAIATESGSGEPYGTEAEIGRDSEVMNVIGVRILPEYRFIKDGESTDFTKEVIPEGMVGVDSWGWDTPDGAGNSPSVRFFQLNNVTNALTKWYAFPDNACTASMMSTYQIKLSVKFGALVCAAEQVPLVVYLPEIPGETTVPILSGFPSCDDRGAGTLPWRVTGPGTLTRSAPKIVFNIHVASQFRNKVSSHEMVHVGQLTTGIGKNINTVAGFFPLIAGLTAKTEAALVTKIQNAFIQYSIIQDLLLLNLTPAMEKAAYGVSDPINPKYLYQNCGRF